MDIAASPPARSTGSPTSRRSRRAGPISTAPPPRRSRRPVIDAITRGYAETYATVHRGVYQRSAEMTLAFEASRRRVAALHQRRRARGDRLRPRRDRGDQPGRAELGPRQSEARRPRPALDARASQQHRALAARRRGDRRGAAHRRPPHRSRRDGGDDPARAQARRARPCLERARLGARRQARGGRSPTRSARSCCSTAARRCRACRSTSPRSIATSTSSPATSSTARPGSACSGRAPRSSTRCRHGRAAAR